MKKLFTVSLVAIMAATAANAEIAGTTFVTALTGDVATLETTAKNLTGAVNELKGQLGSVSTAAGNAATKTELSEGLAEKLGKNENAVSATKATQDAAGNVITETYATKTEMSGKQDALGYTAEDEANKKNSLEGVSNEQKSVFYPTIALMDASIQNANNDVMDAVNSKADKSSVYTKTEVDGLQTAQNTALQTYADGKASAAQTAAEKTASDALQAYKTSNDTAVAGKVAQTEYDAKISELENDISEAASAGTGAAADALTEAKAYTDELANGAVKENTEAIAGLDTKYVSETEMSTFKTSNSEAIAEAKKAGTDAAAAAATADGKADAAQAAAEAAQQTADNKQNKSEKLSLGDEGGAWYDLTASSTGYSTSGTYSLVLKDGDIKWEMVSY